MDLLNGTTFCVCNSGFRNENCSQSKLRGNKIVYKGKGKCRGITLSEVVLEFLSCLIFQCNFRQQSAKIKKCSLVQKMTNRKQCLKLHWIFKQFKNSKTTSEVVVCDYLPFSESTIPFDSITNKGGHGQSGQFYATLATIIVT